MRKIKEVLRLKFDVDLGLRQIAPRQAQYIERITCGLLPISTVRICWLQ